MLDQIKHFYDKKKRQRAVKVKSHIENEMSHFIMKKKQRIDKFLSKDKNVKYQFDSEVVK